ncbi:MAG TPA: CotH kinase family protein [Kofleriaceae bacterium]|nr:CotH kinase family protein [Kofleriaceae bacterium]
MTLWRVGCFAMVAAVLGGCGAAPDVRPDGALAGDVDAPPGGPDAAPPVSPSDPFYDVGTIVDVRLTISPADLATLDADPSAGIYVPGTFDAMGITVPMVGIRYKGNSSLARAGSKKSFKIDMNEYVADQRFLGLGTVNLNNTVLDPSMEREVSAYELFRGFGVIASRANYARVLVNGEYWGLYVNVEEVDKRFLARTFSDNDGNLYKQYAPATLEYRGPSPSSYDTGTYQKKTNETENDWSDLISLCQLLATDDLAMLETRLPQMFDVRSYLRWLAVNTYLSHIDAYTGLADNYYLYRDPATDRFVYIPWDLDITFGTAGHAGTTTAFLLDWNIYNPQIPSPAGTRPLLTKVLAIPAWRAEYTADLAELVDGGAVSTRLTDAITQRRALIMQAALHDPRKPYSDSEFTRSLDEDILATGSGPPAVIGIRAFVQSRTPKVLAQLP